MPNNILNKVKRARMKLDETRKTANALNEISESCAEATHSIKDTTREVSATKKLWQEGNKSTLIKVGVALIAFPDPTISDVVGSALVAAGMVQMGIQRRTMHVGDVVKTFQTTMRELRNTKFDL
ncbi:MAG TPA: hypothetical protein VMT01_03030 [Candidatus Acidoferrum sp.]|nr:hypothetical protein [Candidatus Acidoferrum sp.]